MKPLIDFQVDQVAIHEMLAKQFEEKVNEVIWLVDVNRLLQLTSMSRRLLEEEILSDPRMRAIEIKRPRKRWYQADKAKEVILEIVSEW